MENVLVNRLCLPFLLLFGLLLGYAQIGKQGTVFIRFKPSKVCQKKIYSDGIVFYFKNEDFRVKSLKIIDTLPGGTIPLKTQLTYEQMLAKEHKILQEYAKEIKKEFGIPSPTVPIYHNMFELYVVETLESGKQVKYPVTWRYSIPFRETEEDL